MGTLKNTSITMTTSVVSSKDNKFRYILKKEWNNKKKTALVITKTSHTQIQTYCLKNLCFSKTNIISYSSSRFFQRINHIFW